VLTNKQLKTADGFFYSGVDCLGAVVDIERGFADGRQRAMLESDPSTGGFLATEAFAEDIIGSVYEGPSDILTRIDRRTIDYPASGFKLPGVDETSRADGLRWGGVAATYSAEELSILASAAKVRMVELTWKKLPAIAIVPSELLNDVPSLYQCLRRAFGDEFRYVAERAIIRGTGAGGPLGILRAPATITTPALAGQAAATLTADNITAMWRRMPLTCRRSAVWLVGEGVLDALDDGAYRGIYAPSGSASADDLPRLKGRPVIEHEACSALGTLGDIILADLRWYGFVERPVSSAMSLHARFTADEAVFRLTWRHDAAPWISAPITGTDGTTRSPFVTLAARS
jgi:HK97 family phage major capsid protein